MTLGGPFQPLPFCDPRGASTSSRGDRARSAEREEVKVWMGFSPSRE